MRRPRLSGFAGCLAAVRRSPSARSAFAYFSANGTGNAAAAVTKLTAPTITAATPAAGGAVTLTWSAVTPPGEGTVSYYVTRDGGTPGGQLPEPVLADGGHDLHRRRRPDRRTHL